MLQYVLVVVCEYPIIVLAIQEDIVDKADWVTTVTHIQSSLKDWLKQHKHSDRDPDSEAEIERDTIEIVYSI